MKNVVLKVGYADVHNIFCGAMPLGGVEWEGQEPQRSGEYRPAILVGKPGASDGNYVIASAYKPNSDERYYVGDEHHTYSE